MNGSIEKTLTASQYLRSGSNLSCSRQLWQQLLRLRAVNDWPLAVGFSRGWWLKNTPKRAGGITAVNHLLMFLRCFLLSTPKHTVWRLKVHRVRCGSMWWSHRMSQRLCQWLGWWLTFRTACNANYWNGEKHKTELFLSTLSDIIVFQFYFWLCLARRDPRSKRNAHWPFRSLRFQLGDLNRNEADAAARWTTSTSAAVRYGHRPFVLIKL